MCNGSDTFRRPKKKYIREKSNFNVSKLKVACRLHTTEWDGDGEREEEEEKMIVKVPIISDHLRAKKKDRERRKGGRAIRLDLFHHQRAKTVHESTKSNSKQSLLFAYVIHEISLLDRLSIEVHAKKLE